MIYYIILLLKYLTNYSVTPILPLILIITSSTSRVYPKKIKNQWTIRKSQKGHTMDLGFVEHRHDIHHEL